MSSRRGVHLLVCGPALGLVLVFGSSGLACSGDEPSPPGAAGHESSPPDANRPAPPDTDAAPKTCREQCREAHPVGVPKDEAVNECWALHCNGPCLEGTNEDAGPDGASADGGACVSPVVTVSASCDECTNSFCCTEWDGCFQEPECAALNACYQQCSE